MAGCSVSLPGARVLVPAAAGLGRWRGGGWGSSAGGHSVDACAPALRPPRFGVQKTALARCLVGPSCLNAAHNSETLRGNGTLINF